MTKKVSLRELAQNLGVSRSSLYYQPKRSEQDEKLRRLIESVMIKNPGYGHRRVAIALGINRKRALRVMKKFNLKPARRAKAPRKPDDLKKADAGYPDMTKVLSAITPQFLWRSDFTFINFHGQFVYFATVIDDFTCEVLGISIMTRHTAALTLGALEDALKKTEQLPTWFHSDQGSEYTAFEFIEMLISFGISISMNPKASPWRNGSQESFFGRFKVEFGDPDRFDILPELIEAIYGYVSYYNQERIHTCLRMSPLQFKTNWETSQRNLLTDKLPLPLPQQKINLHICTRLNDLSMT